MQSEILILEHKNKKLRDTIADKNFEIETLKMTIVRLQANSWNKYYKWR